jgi:hypothetical protein
MAEGILLIAALVCAWGWMAAERRQALTDREQDALEMVQLAADMFPESVPGHRSVGHGLTVDDLRNLAAIGRRLGAKVTPVRDRYGAKSLPLINDGPQPGTTV